MTGVEIVNERKLFDPKLYRKDFPILNEKINGNPLIYFDNAATTQKPQVVIDAIVNYYHHTNANVHRGIHSLSERATLQFEDVRVKVKTFIGAKSIKEIIFCKGATEAINCVAQSYVKPQLKPGDEILIGYLEHHSNIVPWQLISRDTGATLKVIPMNEHGELIVEDIEPLITNKTKFLALNHISNALGTINPIKKIVQIAHAYHVPVLIDGAQAIPHIEVDVGDIDSEFYVFSGHKMYGPTGIGVLYGKEEYLEQMRPYQGGGDMILHVTFETTEFNALPYRFEAGTPPIAEVIGLGAAIDYLKSVGLKNIASYENQLLNYAIQLSAQVKKLRLIGTAKNKASIFNFVLEEIHPHDIGTILNSKGIAIRTGHHCAMPIMDFFKVPATARASFSFYNTFEEVEQMFQALTEIESIFNI